MKPTENKTISFNLPLAVVTIAGLSLLFFIGISRLHIKTDLVDSLPQKDPAVSDAIYIFKHHPIKDQIVIDVGVETRNPDLLVEVGNTIEQMLMESGLFVSVGMKDMQSLVPDLIFRILDNLPYLFSERELEENVLPLITPSAIRKMLTYHYNHLYSMNSIGRMEFISKDPFGLKDLILSKLSSLAPSGEAMIYKEKLLSKDGKHLLLTASPIQSGTDTAFARKLTDLIGNITLKISKKYATGGNRVTLSPVGGYRSALDNETIIKNDVQRALFFTTIGIIILLLFSFSRPLMGLLSFVPAVSGVVMAFFLYSLFHESISIMVIGFGGAIISITVDHGISYLLFLDRPNVSTRGKEASREVWAIGLIATMTSVGAFSMLVFSGFPVLVQLGQFTALGILFSFLFVHTVFPRIFPEMPPAAIEKKLLNSWVEKLTNFGMKGAVVVFIFGIFMAFFAKPVFHINLSAMNTVSQDTAAAEALMEKVWGNIFGKIYLMTEGQNIKDLQDKTDRMIEEITEDIRLGYLSSGFSPSMIFPGKALSTEHFHAWQHFWNEDRVRNLKHHLTAIGEEMGFTADAFLPFYELISGNITYQAPTIPKKFWGLLGISNHPGDYGKDALIAFLTFTTGHAYDAEHFYQEYGSFGKIFDSEQFTRTFGNLLFSTFVKLLVIIGISLSALLLLFFLDLKLTVISLTPVVFALISTLGTLKLMGHPLDIPCLMLSIVVLGMGIDYSLFFVRSYQRYGSSSHPSFRVIKMAIFMAASSTLIGFGVLCLSDHAVLKSAGLTSLLGIGYSLIGAFVLLPPLLEKVFQAEKNPLCEKNSIHDCVLERYRQMEANARMFAKFKLRLDPMFEELPGLVGKESNVKTIMDIGSGYGVPGCWLLERFKEARLFGIEPDPERIRVASRAVSTRGKIVQGKAPSVPQSESLFDLAVMLDMGHYLTDDELTETLQHIRNALIPGGRLIIRISLPSGNKFSFLWWVEEMKSRLNGLFTCYRPIPRMEELIKNEGFKLELTELSGTKGDLAWFSARK